MRILLSFILLLVMGWYPSFTQAAPTVNLSWSPNTEKDLDSYTIYRGMINCDSQGPLQPLITVDKAVTSFTDTTLPATTTQACYRLTAKDLSGNESLQSDQVSKSFPVTPPPPPPPPVPTVHIAQNIKVETDGTTATFSWIPGSCTVSYQLMRYGTRSNTKLSETKGNFILYTLPKGSNSQYFISSVCADGSIYNSTLQFTLKQGSVEVKR